MEMVFSVSRLKSFASCAYRASWKYVQGNVEPETEPLVFGKCVHEVLSNAGEFYNVNRTLPKRNDMSAWVKEQEEVAKKKGLLSATALKEIGKLARRGVDRFEEVPSDARMLVEHHFTVPVPGREGSFLQGFIDLGYITADGEEAVIEDYKTNRKSYEVAKDPMNTDDRTGDPAHQLPLYAWALMQEFPTVKRVKIRLNFLRLKQWSEKEYDLGIGEAAVQYLTAEADRILAMYESKEFPATPGSVCGTCSAALTCPVANAPLSADIWAREDAERLFGHMLATEAKLELLKGPVRGYVEYNGPIEAGGEWAALLSKPVLTFTDKVTVMAGLHAMGLNELDFLSLDQSALRDMAEEDPKVAALGFFKPGNARFDHKSSEPDETELAQRPGSTSPEEPAEAAADAPATEDAVPAA